MVSPDGTCYKMDVTEYVPCLPSEDYGRVYTAPLGSIQEINSMISSAVYGGNYTACPSVPSSDDDDMPKDDGIKNAGGVDSDETDRAIPNGIATSTHQIQHPLLQRLTPKVQLPANTNRLVGTW